MKFLDKFNLALFSIIIIVISLLIILLSIGWLDIIFITDKICYLFLSSNSNQIILGVAIVLILLAIKSIFFNSYSKEEIKNKEGILLENDNGKLLISKDTIESLTNTVVKSFDSAENVMTRIDVDKESKVKVYITLFVYPDSIIKDLSSKLQTDVKNTIKNSLDLEVTEVNIRIKNISIKKEPIIKE